MRIRDKNGIVRIINASDVLDIMEEDDNGCSINMNDGNVYQFTQSMSEVMKMLENKTLFIKLRSSNGEDHRIMMHHIVKLVASDGGTVVITTGDHVGRRYDEDVDDVEAFINENFSLG